MSDLPGEVMPYNEMVYQVITLDYNVDGNFKIFVLDRSKLFHILNTQ
jgi:hypothetical protein